MSGQKVLGGDKCREEVSLDEDICEQFIYRYDITLSRTRYI